MEQRGTDCPLFVYDLTIKGDLPDYEKIKTYFNEIAKEWCFQYEEGESGYKHFQCRISLKNKMRPSTLYNKLNKSPIRGAHASPTSVANRDNDWYTSKEETRIAGPWKHTDPEIMEGIDANPKWYPWQMTIVDSLKGPGDKRWVNCIINPSGAIGKSYLRIQLQWAGIITYVPPLNDFKVLVEYISSQPDGKAYIIDLPKAIPKKNQQGMYSAIELLKDRTVFDTRYHGTSRLMKYVPHVWVFTNKMPDTKLLSDDRWQFWKVDSGHLIPYYNMVTQPKEVPLVINVQPIEVISIPPPTQPVTFEYKPLIPVKPKKIIAITKTAEDKTQF